MRIAKIVLVVVLVYATIVIAFESLIGYFQPAGATTLVISTTDGGGTVSDRVVSRLDSGGQLYVAANHWPRAWYRQVLAHPEVQVTVDGTRADYRAVPVEGVERDQVTAEHPLGPFVRFLTGYPPRRIVRLDPR